MESEGRRWSENSVHDSNPMTFTEAAETPPHSERKEEMAKGELKRITEREATASGISRGQLIAAAEWTFLYNRDAMARWTAEALERVGKLGDPQRVAGIGLLRQTLERLWGIPPNVSEEIIQMAPRCMVDDLCECVWADGTGRNAIEECCCSLLNYYNGMRGQYE